MISPQKKHMQNNNNINKQKNSKHAKLVIKFQFRTVIANIMLQIKLQDHSKQKQIFQLFTIFYTTIYN